MKLSDIDANFKIENKIESDIEWHEISENSFDLYGVYYSAKDEEYLRFPKGWAKSFNEYVVYHANRTAGGRVKFQTDSPYIAVKVVATHLDLGDSVRGAIGAALYTDDYFSAPFSPCLDFINGLARGEDVSYSGIYRISSPHSLNITHDFTLYFPILNGVKRVYIGIKKGSTLQNGKKYNRQTPIVFYGSSITMGCGATRAGGDYVSSLCRMLNSDFINLGLAGQAKGQREMAKYVAKLKASVFVMDYDYNAPSAQYLQDTHYPFYKIIREENSNAPIVFISQPNIDYCADTVARREVIVDTYKRAIKEGDRNVYFIDGATLFEGDLRDNCTDDRCHPNALGHYRMAKTAYPVFEKILKNNNKEI